jgi:phosphoglycerate dehydrogenase-like enzyme
VQIFSNVEFSAEGRERLARDVAPDAVYFGDPDQFGEADRAGLRRSEVAFGSCPAEMLEQSEGLRWLQLDSVGCDQYRHLDWPALSARLTVTNLRGFFSVPVAETGIAGVLALVRAIDRLVELRRAREWRSLDIRSQLRTLHGARALVIGYGGIGHALADRLAAFGSEIETFGTPASGAGLTTLPELDGALPRADVVFLALPETAATAGLFGASRLGLLKETAILVNLGRGGLVDEDALVRQLDQGALAGAVIDVTQTEPLPADSPLWSAPNVILTQHTAGGSADELAGKAAVFLANLKRYRAGLPLNSVVDWAKGY